MFSRISDVGPNRKLVPSTPRLSFWAQPPHRPQCAATLLFAEMYVPGGCMCLLLKKNIDFLLFYDFVPEIYKKKTTTTTTQK